MLETADPAGARRADALVRLAGQAMDHAECRRAGAVDGDRHLVTVLVDAGELASKRAEQPGGDPRGAHGAGEGVCQVADGPALEPQTARRLACDQPTVRIVEDGGGNVLDVGRRTRRISRPLRRALARRDRHCRFPGCTNRFTHAHHIQHWVDGGPTRLDNLVQLCSFHHHRLHEGGYAISRHDGTLDFIRPDGIAVRPVNPLAPTTEVGPADLPASAGADPHLDSNWDGTPLPLHDIVAGLLAGDPEPAPTEPPAELVGVSA